MERAVYCYGWLPGRPNCHPVHPTKNIGMVEDLERNRATMLSWSMMGSGAISLPFLENQIYGELPPAARFHGYLNDKEFNEECLKRGIRPYAVVYQAQGWEFPIRTDGKGHIREMNFIRSDGPHEWYGLREFTQDRMTELFGKTFADYFPDGLVNSDGEKVADLWEECTTRTLYGEPAHSHWVEVNGLSQTCHGTCRNNPVWREYLKKIVEIQIDAGAKAIQLDESETPICSFGYGGCFCKDCTKQFREFLKKRRDAGTLPPDLAKEDLDRFDYGAFLRERHINWPENFLSIPYADLYWEFMVEAHNKHFQEIIRHVKEYGKQKTGEDIKVSGNFTNMHLLYLPSLPYVDCCITELRRTVFRRHNWFRLARGYAGEKPLILAESPYDGFMPKFVELIHRGKGDDYYRMFMMEAAAHGISMAFPYGAWMGNQTSESFHAPYETGRQVQDFLARHDDLFSVRSGANVLVLYSYADNMMRDWQCGHGENLSYTDSEDLFSYSVTYDERAARMPFFEITQELVNRQIPFDVRIAGDGGAVPDTLSAADLEGYDLILFPDETLTSRQAALLENRPFLRYDGTEPASAFADRVEDRYEAVRKIRWDNPECAVQMARTEQGTVLHLLNYALDKQNSRTIPQTVTVELRMENLKNIRTYTLSGEPLRYELLPAAADGQIRVRVTGLPVYGAVLLETKGADE